MKITILGAGSFGKAIAKILAAKAPALADIEPDGTYSKRTQEQIHGSELLIIAVPSQALKNCLKMIKPLVRKETKIISCVKGLYYKNDLLTPTMMIKRELEIEAGTLSGPNISEEIEKELPTFTVLSGPKWIWEIAPHFKTDYFQAVIETDTKGVEFGGAAKNILAIAAGLIEGKYGKHSSNTKGATVAILMEEMERVYSRFQQRKIPQLGYLADTITTMTSGLSRNKKFGKRIGRKEKGIKRLYEQLGTVEGYDTLSALYEYVKEKHIDAPTIKSLYKVIYREGKVETLTEWELE